MNKESYSILENSHLSDKMAKITYVSHVLNCQSSLVFVINLKFKKKKGCSNLKCFNNIQKQVKSINLSKSTT